MQQISVRVIGGAAHGQEVLAPTDPQSSPQGSPQESVWIAMVDGHAAVLRADPMPVPVGPDWVRHRRHGSPEGGWEYRPADAASE